VLSPHYSMALTRALFVATAVIFGMPGCGGGGSSSDSSDLPTLSGTWSGRLTLISGVNCVDSEGEFFFNRCWSWCAVA